MGSRSAVSVHYQERLHERLPALAPSIAPLRRSVLGFASDSGASARREDIALAVSEALSNAVLHAYVGRDSPGSMAVEARVDGDMLEVTVCDDGIGMRPRGDSPGLGLGLSLIVRVTDHVEVDSHDGIPGVRLRMTFVIG